MFFLGSRLLDRLGGLLNAYGGFKTVRIVVGYWPGESDSVDEFFEGLSSVEQVTISPRHP